MIQKLSITLYLICALSPAIGAERGYFGVWFANLPDSEKEVQTGVIVKKVFAGMPSQQVGLKPGEIITQINGGDADDPPTAVALLAKKGAGEKVRLTVIERTADGLHRSYIVAIMADKPTEEFANVVRGSPPCPSSPSSSGRRCTPGGWTRIHTNGTEGHGPTAVPGWMLLVLCGVTGLGLLVNVIWRFNKDAG